MAADAVAAVVEILRGSSAVTSLVGVTGTDPWIFQEGLYVIVKTSGKGAVVVSQRGPWAAPNIYNTAQFPRILVECIFDATRTGNTLQKPDAPRRAKACALAVRNVLHRPDQSVFSVLAGTDRIIGSRSLDEPDPQDVPDSDMSSVRSYYALVLG